MIGSFERFAQESADIIENAGLDEVQRFVNPEPISGITDEYLINEASSEANCDITWDNLADYGYGVPISDVPMSAWRKRFDYEFRKTLRRSDEFIGEPDAFVEAVWRSQRILPTIGEYASMLGSQGILRPDEVKAADVVSVLEDAPESERRDQLESMSEDDRWLYDKVRYKLEYLINLHPESEASQNDIQKQAEIYATKKCAISGDVLKHGKQARRLLLEARGLTLDEIKTISSAAHISSQTDLYYQLRGVNSTLAEHMSQNVGGSLLRDWQDPVHKVGQALSGNLNSQLAVRRFFGIDNLYELLNYQKTVDRAYQGSPERAYKFVGAGLVGAVLKVDPALVRTANSPTDINIDESTFKEPELMPGEAERFELLAGFVVHEPSLRPFLYPAARDELAARYLSWIENNEG